MTEERAFWVGFNHIRGIGSVRMQKLLSAFGTLQKAWGASFGEYRAAGLDERTSQSICLERRSLDPVQLLDKCRQAGMQVLIRVDAGYPVRLKEVPAPPPVLYVRGEIRDGDAWSVALVGTRRSTAYGREVARHFAGSLAARGMTIVSGLARGIDAVAHGAALEGGGRTIAVLGSGADRTYPPEHDKLAERIAGSGAVISDYPPGTPPDAANFPPRNRLIAGLSVGTVIIEAGIESGALLTAKYAADYGRDVFAVPGSVLSPMSAGCNRLIREGAIPALEPEDILTEIEAPGLLQAQPMQIPVPESPVEAKILQALGTEPMHIDHLRHLVGLPIDEVSSALALMEIRGQVRTVGGMQFIAGGMAAGGRERPGTAHRG